MNLLPEKTIEVWGGMECTVNRVRNNYYDQLELSGHRRRKGDIALFALLGLKKMRYPIIWEYHQPFKDTQIDWSDTNQKLQELRSHNIDVIAGLVHHGSGPKHVEITNNSFANGLALYASEIAKRFPWINYYTPVNEPLTTARFCGLYGHWYPHAKSDHSFCRILVNEIKATVMAMKAIRLINPDARLVQTEDLTKVHSCSSLSYQATFENERRWLSFDLLCGFVNEDHSMWPYLVEHGITASELNYFLANPCPPDIMGVNHYLTSERYLDVQIHNYPAHTHGGNGKQTYADVEAVRVGSVQPTGIEQLLREAWDRYRIPIAITEVHVNCTREEQMRWLNDIWLFATQCANDGVEVIAITPWALLGSYGWDKLLTDGSQTYESGVFDLAGGYPRPTILVAMIKQFSKGNMYFHHILNGEGWWKRPSRVFYGPKPEPGVDDSINLLTVMGSRAAELEAMCKNRNLKLNVEIIIGEVMTVITPGKPNLVIHFQDSPNLCQLNAGLDLLIDEVFGHWKVMSSGASGRLQKNQPFHHAIVS